MKNYNTTPWNNVSFTTNGYVKQAVVFRPNAGQMLTAPYMPLASTSFTIETWIYITGLANVLDQSIFGLCPSASNYHCLHLTIRKAAPSFYLYFSFFGADCRGTIPVALNTWTHVASVFDMIKMKQFIYFNGVLDNNCVVSQPVLATSGNVTIGYIPAIAQLSVNNYFQVTD